MGKLAEIRGERCLSQNDLVKLSGVSRSLVTKYESGEKNINKAAGETLLKIATALSCRIEDLIEGKEKISQEVLYRMYCEWRKATEEANEDLDINIQPGSVDCGESAVREDFSNYIGREKEISFEEMLELEKMWEEEHQN